jgi:flagellar basal-body rod modification protein FlgD
MPDTIRELRKELTPQELAQAKRDADFVNQKHKAEGKNYGQGLGKDAFLKLLVTELTHQDPTKPMQDREFIAQMAQFSSLEQMNNVNTQMQQLNQGNKISEAYSLIGKDIESLDADTGRIIRGEVTHVVRQGDEILLGVGTNRVRLDDIHAVYPNKKAEVQTQPAPVKQVQEQLFTAPVEHIEEYDVEMDLIGEESTYKGMRNSFNQLQKNYDTSNRRDKEAAAQAYGSQ